MVKHLAGICQSYHLDRSQLTLFSESTDAACLLGDHAFVCGYCILPPTTVVEHAAERIICHSSYLIHSEGSQMILKSIYQASDSCQ